MFKEAWLTSLQRDLVFLLRSVFHSADSCSTVGGSSFARKQEATMLLPRKGPRRPKRRTATLGWMSLTASGLFQTCQTGRPRPQVGPAASLGSDGASGLLGDQHPRSGRQLPGAACSSPGLPALVGLLGPGLWVRWQCARLPMCLPGSEAEAGSGELSGSHLGLEPRAPLYQVFKLNHIVIQSNCLQDS